MYMRGGTSKQQEVFGCGCFRGITHFPEKFFLTTCVPPDFMKKNGRRAMIACLQGPRCPLGAPRLCTRGLFVSAQARVTNVRREIPEISIETCHPGASTLSRVGPQGRRDGDKPQSKSWSKTSSQGPRTSGSTAGIRRKGTGGGAGARVPRGAPLM
jgi:hypothetical protein